MNAGARQDRKTESKHGHSLFTEERKGLLALSSKFLPHLFTRFKSRQWFDFILIFHFPIKVPQLWDTWNVSILNAQFKKWSLVVKFLLSRLNSCAMFPRLSKFAWAGFQGILFAIMLNLRFLERICFPFQTLPRTNSRCKFLQRSF